MRFETSRDYAHPHRPLPLRALNSLPFGKRLEVDALLAAARRAAKLEELAEPLALEFLAQLVASLEREASLTTTGRLLTATNARTNLIVNLRAAAWAERSPIFATLPLARPIMICGLARSGTTLLQRLLAQLPGARALATWEAIEPIPPLDWRPPASTPSDARIRKARGAETFLRWLSPDLFAAHPMDALAPEEEVMLLDKLFMSSVAETSYHVPSFARWLEGQDRTPAYRWLARCLRHLQTQRGGDFWVLKSPHHLEHLDTVFEVFPEITVIQTHRDPSETVPSFCSLVAHGWGVMSDRVDPREVGRHWSRKIERMLARAMATRDARDDRSFVDVFYRDLLDDPLAVVERLCAQLELPWDEGIRAKLATWLESHRQHEHGLHRYAAEDFGLRRDDLDARFAGYRQRFELG
ncbi:sulfotransferase [Pseudenhygromyxa sp. WMMC2535]|uniref:sulfotransferase family protein n=1 Tax=Pseudenhygromyxa sp. WMMC2535 TaxID=2712867 RepID=UPI001555C815|nr:sulfotransferase [Pseudenhygromyxa sp. WMMC2535]NVB41479.1 sulfotransferase [Pseudenhygromyxa sp. WMMC2535]